MAFIGNKRQYHPHQKIQHLSLLCSALAFESAVFYLNLTHFENGHEVTSNYWGNYCHPKPKLSMFFVLSKVINIFLGKKCKHPEVNHVRN